MKPQQGQALLKILAEDIGPGLMDRLIADDYAASAHRTLTNDRQMRELAECEFLG